MHASLNVGSQGKSGPGKIHEVILVLIIFIFLCLASLIKIWKDGKQTIKRWNLEILAAKNTTETSRFVFVAARIF